MGTRPLGTTDTQLSVVGLGGVELRATKGSSARFYGRLATSCSLPPSSRLRLTPRVLGTTRFAPAALQASTGSGATGLTSTFPATEPGSSSVKADGAHRSTRLADCPWRTEPRLDSTAAALRAVSRACEAVERAADCVLHGLASGVPRVVDDNEPGIGPGSGQFPGRLERRAHVEPAMDQDPGDAG